MNAVLVKGTNLSVIDYYYEVILKSLKRLGVKTREIELKQLRKNVYDVVVFGELTQVLHYNKNTKYIYWAQGIIPEESMMRNNSWLRYYVLGLLEKRVLKKADFIFFVSDIQKKYYEQKYKLLFPRDKYFIMPCYNEQINVNSFTFPQKYDKNIFCYVGSLAVWQCFNETVALYKKIEEVVSCCEFRVFTSDVEEAIRILKECNVERYSVEFVQGDLLHTKLRECKFGFILRKDTAVNNVATPTKMSNYLANGVIPIYSSCLYAFNNLSSQFKYLLPVSGAFEIDNIVNLASQKIDPIDIKEEYIKIFNYYYNTDYYIEQISLCLNRLVER